MSFRRPGPLVQQGLFVVVLFLGMGAARADAPITREYWLKHNEVPLVAQSLNVLLTAHKERHILAGQGKHLVVTAPEDQQEEIADLLTVLDKPMTATNSDKKFLEMIEKGLFYLKQQKSDVVAIQKKEGTYQASAPSGGGPAIMSGVRSYDTYKSTRSVFAEEDARMMRERRRIVEEPVLPSVTDLTLKGIFRPNLSPPMGLLSYGTTLFVARDGGLFERNQNRVKGVISEVLKDKVILTGPDRIPREFKFKSTL